LVKGYQQRALNFNHHHDTFSNFISLLSGDWKTQEQFRRNGRGKFSGRSISCWKKKDEQSSGKDLLHTYVSTDTRQETVINIV
jgi:hypothetical protein